VAATRTGRVGVIGTTATITSGAYVDAFAAAPHVSVTGVACPAFVDYVERGVTSGPDLLRVAESYLAQLQQADVDTLVLGCTHYPLLAGLIGFVMGESVTLVSSADETAREVYRVLTEQDLLRTEIAPPDHHFLATGEPASFRRLAQRFLGPTISDVSTVDVVVAGVHR
jgi:glutamate racemase